MLSFKINYSLYVVLVRDMGYWLKIEVDFVVEKKWIHFWFYYFSHSFEIPVSSPCVNVNQRSYVFPRIRYH